jgi:hypothetical protein
MPIAGWITGLLLAALPLLFLRGWRRERHTS